SFLFSSRRRHTRFSRDWSSDVCSSDLTGRETSYETVDYGLTMLLYTAIGAARPRFVYLSSAGVPDREPGNAYLRARYRVERALRSEERRVGKEWRIGWATNQLKRETRR